MGSRLHNLSSAIWPLPVHGYPDPEDAGNYRQPWLHSAAFDVALITGPAIFSVIAVLVLALWAAPLQDVPLWAWVVLILGIDVAHVYSTLFRTYLDPAAFNRHKTLLAIVPLLCWVAGCLLYSLGDMVFWRVLAYVAVFHFVRQQYGFLMIYMRTERQFKKIFWQKFDAAVLYLSMIYPLVYWHSHLPRSFNWFVEGDFFTLPVIFEKIAAGIYLILLGTYVLKEIFILMRYKVINIPKNLLILSTASAWYVGIVLFNADMAFTLTNVVAHGIPYLALIWLYSHRTGQQQSPTSAAPPYKFLVSVAGVPVFLAILWALAYVEEGFWDGLVWGEQKALFAWFSYLPLLTDRQALSWLLPLLAVPQFSHYVLDGFIWRLKPGKDTQWTDVFKPENMQS